MMCFSCCCAPGLQERDGGPFLTLFTLSVSRYICFPFKASGWGVGGSTYTGRGEAGGSGSPRHLEKIKNSKEGTPAASLLRLLFPVPSASGILAKASRSGGFAKTSSGARSSQSVRL